MLFNSIDFIVFLPLVFILYWGIFNRNLKAQNIFIVLASYVFYGWWDWRFLFLMFFSTIVDFGIANLITKNPLKSKRKLLLITSLVINLGLLGIFKYYNFFIENFVSAFSLLGMELNMSSLNIILPVGISFYTFQTLSYTIDVHRGVLKPTNSLIDFMAFVSFFPQLVAGPIERATNLLPQFHSKRVFKQDLASDGLRQILWGLFKKVVIADNCAHYANLIFNNSDEFNGISLLIGAILFSIQIYGDFSGYSDIAIGVSKLFGFDLMRNFAFPYFSRDIAEFWRRWHISLTTWFKDYIYIPLGGSQGGLWHKIRNTFIIFLISGFWHGANWTFIVWGGLNAIYFLPLLLTNRNKKHINLASENRFLPSISDLYKMAFTFFIVVISWIFFRAENMNHAMNYLAEIFSMSLFEVPNIVDKRGVVLIFALILFMFIVEWIGRKHLHALVFIEQISKRSFRWSIYAFIIFLMGMYMHTEEMPFIYFQF